jgi:hypothetical protein
MASVSPTFARAMVSYRENRTVDGVNVATGDIGFATLGEMCEIVERAKVVAYNPYDNSELAPDTVEGLREYGWTDSATGLIHRPFSYLGYQHLIAPIVRLQDWATVKSHVYTIYATVSKSSSPPIHMRTQVTVDRTSCLYDTNQLPERISVTEPVSYFATSD